MRFSLLTRSRRGFTIVEVMIVLAIAGVIMSVVFLAVPQLQRNSRDSQRQSVLQMVRTEIETYAANNTGKYPLSYAGANNCSGTTKSGDFADFYCRYISNGSVQYKDDKDPSSKESIFRISGAEPKNYRPVQCGVTTGNCTAAKPTTGKAQIVIHAKCNGANAATADGQIDGPTVTSFNTRSYAMIIGLERANTYFCIDNS